MAAWRERCSYRRTGVTGQAEWARKERAVATKSPLLSLNVQNGFSSSKQIELLPWEWTVKSASPPRAQTNLVTTCFHVTVGMKHSPPCSQGFLHPVILGFEVAFFFKTVFNRAVFEAAGNRPAWTSSPSPWRLGNRDWLIRAASWTDRCRWRRRASDRGTERGSCLQWGPPWRPGRALSASVEQGRSSPGVSWSSWPPSLGSAWPVSSLASRWPSSSAWPPCLSAACAPSAPRSPASSACAWPRDLLASSVPSPLPFRTPVCSSLPCAPSQGAAGGLLSVRSSFAEPIFSWATGPPLTADRPYSCCTPAARRRDTLASGSGCLG